MSEQLPVSIVPCQELSDEFSKIISVANKLEAQFNFHTMTANWYGDEDNIFFVQLHLNTPSIFSEIKEAVDAQELTTHSDDVFSFYLNKESEQTLICHIAITDSELTLLTQQPKLLAPLLNVKLQKVLNLIANKLNLTTI
jgi:hypothetical protein